MRLNTATWVAIGAAVGIVLVFTTNQVVPASSAYQAQIRVWLAARASGITAYVLLSVLVSFGLILSHPTNQSTWKLSKRLFPWHENLFVFTVAFLVAHIVSLVIDPFAGIGNDAAAQLAGTFIPGLSMYRSAPVALGTLAMYALLLSGITARWTKLLPQGFWLKLHRFALVAWALTWVHGLLSGTDALVLVPLYAVTGLAVMAAAAYRYWVSKKGRPTFATSLPGATPPRAPAASERSAHAPTPAIGSSGLRDATLAAADGAPAAPDRAAVAEAREAAPDVAPAVAPGVAPAVAPSGRLAALGRPGARRELTPGGAALGPQPAARLVAPRPASSLPTQPSLALLIHVNREESSR